jgi:hypothetical protein
MAGDTPQFTVERDVRGAVAHGGGLDALSFWCVSHYLDLDLRNLL